MNDAVATECQSWLADVVNTVIKGEIPVKISQTVGYAKCDVQLLVKLQRQLSWSDEVETRRRAQRTEQTSTWSL